MPCLRCIFGGLCCLVRIRIGLGKGSAVKGTGSTRRGETYCRNILYITYSENPEKNMLIIQAMVDHSHATIIGPRYDLKEWLILRRQNGDTRWYKLVGVQPLQCENCWLSHHGKTISQFAWDRHPIIPFMLDRKHIILYYIILYYIIYYIILYYSIEWYIILHYIISYYIILYYIIMFSYIII